MKRQTAIMEWTLVQHSAFGFKGDPCFQKAVEVWTLTSKKDSQRVEKSGGLLFDNYRQASEAEYNVNYPEERIMGLIPRCRGSFSTRKIGGLRIYIPPTKEKAE